jgi:hypothetical protein
LIVGNYYVLTLLVFIAATACALVLTRRLRPERGASTLTKWSLTILRWPRPSPRSSVW